MIVRNTTFYVHNQIKMRVGGYDTYDKEVRKAVCND